MIISTDWLELTKASLFNKYQVAFCWCKTFSYREMYGFKLIELSMISAHTVTPFLSCGCIADSKK